LDALSGLTNLYCLGLSLSQQGSEDGITGNISALKNLSKLENLGLNYEGIEGDIANLSELTNLNEIVLNWTNVSGDTSSFTKLTPSEVILVDTKVEGEVSDFAHMPLRLLRFSEYIQGDFSDLGRQADLEDINMSYMTKIRVKPSDKELFPKLNVDESFFEPLKVVTENSQLTYQLGYPEGYENYIKLYSNKAMYGVSTLFVDGVEVPQTEGDVEYYSFNYDEEAQESYMFIWGSYLEGLEAGDHTATLDLYSVGSADATITILGEPTDTIAELFPDKNFAAAVAQALGKEVNDTVAQIELDSIWSFNANDVKNWKGVELLSNLSMPWIVANEGYDLKYLEGLKKIPGLNLVLIPNSSEYAVTDIAMFNEFNGLPVVSTFFNLKQKQSW
jgi:hypothetical protein